MFTFTSQNRGQSNVVDRMFVIELLYGKVPMTGWQPPDLNDLLAGIHRKVAPMTAYEIISIFIGILALLMSFGSLIVAFLAFLDKRYSKKK